MADVIAMALREQTPGLTEGDVAAAISKALMDMPGMSQADIEAAVESAMAKAAAAEAMAMEKSEEAMMAKEESVSLPEPQAAVTEPVSVW